MLIVGEKEMEQEHVSVRHRGFGDRGSMDIESFIKLVQEAIEDELSSNVKN